MKQEADMYYLMLRLLSDDMQSGMITHNQYECYVNRLNRHYFANRVSDSDGIQ